MLVVLYIYLESLPLISTTFESAIEETPPEEVKQDESLTHVENQSVEETSALESVETKKDEPDVRYFFALH